MMFSSSLHLSYVGYISQHSGSTPRKLGRSHVRV